MIQDRDVPFFISTKCQATPRFALTSQTCGRYESRHSLILRVLFEAVRTMCEFPQRAISEELCAWVQTLTLVAWFLAWTK